MSTTSTRKLCSSSCRAEGNANRYAMPPRASSGPAITSRANLRSTVLRAIGPATARSLSRGNAGRLETFVRAKARDQGSACERRPHNSAPAHAANHRCRSRATAGQNRRQAPRRTHPRSRPACGPDPRDCGSFRRCRCSSASRPAKLAHWFLPNITAPAALRRATVETAGGVFQVREDEPVPRIGAGLHRTP